MELLMKNGNTYMLRFIVPIEGQNSVEGSKIYLRKKHKTEICMDLPTASQYCYSCGNTVVKL